MVTIVSSVSVNNSYSKYTYISVYYSVFLSNKRCFISYMPYPCVLCVFLKFMCVSLFYFNINLL